MIDSLFHFMLRKYWKINLDCGFFASSSQGSWKVFWGTVLCICDQSCLPNDNLIISATKNERLFHYYKPN